MLNGKSKRRGDDSDRSRTVPGIPGQLAIVRLVLGFVNSTANELFVADAVSARDRATASAGRRSGPARSLRDPLAR